MACATGAISTAVAVFEMNRPSIAVMTKNAANTRCGAVPQTKPTLPGVYFSGCRSFWSSLRVNDAAKRKVDMDKLKWAVFIFAAVSIVGGAVVYMTGQQGLNRDSFFVAVFGSLTFILGLSLLTRTLFRRQNRSK
jgi:hypothetical protein